MRLDRFLSNQPHLSRQQARIWLATGQVWVDQVQVRDPGHPVTPFNHIRVPQGTLQARQPRYLMLNKPAGFLSATRDDRHLTVLDLLANSGFQTDNLHIAGRLDRGSTGLLLLTDDGLWSRALTQPESSVAKVYRVETAHPIDPEAQAVFAKGIYFGFENIRTRPVQMEQLGPTSARLTLHEGRYHQIKRMFGRFRNPVVGLHREQIGVIELDRSLAPGQWRALTPAEIASVSK